VAESWKKYWGLLDYPFQNFSDFFERSLKTSCITRHLLESSQIYQKLSEIFPEIIRWFPELSKKIEKPKNTPKVLREKGKS
jgi:hypothetical protein